MRHHAMKILPLAAAMACIFAICSMPMISKRVLAGLMPLSDIVQCTNGYRKSSADSSSSSITDPYYNHEHRGERLETTATATPSSTSPLEFDASNHSATHCQWTVIMGDSNNRNSYSRWLDAERRYTSTALGGIGTQGSRIVISAVRSPLLYDKAGDSGHKCEGRWSDQEMLILTPLDDSASEEQQQQYSCHIVTSKFSIDQRVSLHKYRTNMHNTSYCGSDLSNPLQMLSQKYPDVVANNKPFQRPSRPDVYWFSTGFWHVHSTNRSGSPYGELCESRFAPQVEALKEWQHAKTWDDQKPHVHWQTLFPIVSHPLVKNDMITWDYQCQKHLAHKHHLPIIDMYDRVTTDGTRKIVTDYHLQPAAYDRIFVRAYWDKCCGGWEHYQQLLAKGQPPGGQPQRAV